MTTALITHPDCLRHVTPPVHPERVERLQTLLRLFEEDRFRDLVRRSAPLCDRAHLLRAHPESHLERIAGTEPREGVASLDADTHMSPGSHDAALRAAGANILAADLVLKGDVGNAFCAVRPPGHHAEGTRAMGFCLFGSVAIGALHALETHGLERVAVVDFDVHHGNGTSDILWDRPGAFFASTHQMPLYPGTGHPGETGKRGRIVNVPLNPGDGGEAFRRAMESILSELDDFTPQCVFISAGFDAHRRDPLANLELEDADFAWATEAICDVADAHCAGRVISSLEGGYDLDALASGTAAHLEVLMRR